MHVYEDIRHDRCFVEFWTTNTEACGNEEWQSSVLLLGKERFRACALVASVQYAVIEDFRPSRYGLHLLVGWRMPGLTLIQWKQESAKLDRFPTRLYADLAIPLWTLWRLLDAITSHEVSDSTCLQRSLV
jgi:hypothetical protein